MDGHFCCIPKLLRYLYLDSRYRWICSDDCDDKTVTENKNKNKLNMELVQYSVYQYRIRISGSIRSLLHKGVIRIITYRVIIPMTPL